MTSTALEALRVPIPPPTTEQERKALSGWHSELESKLSAAGVEEEAPFGAALMALGDELDALAAGTSVEMAKHRRLGYSVWGFAESSTEEVHEAAMALLDGVKDGAGEQPGTLAELRAAHAQWNADREKWERWLDRAEELLERGENR